MTAQAMQTRVRATAVAAFFSWPLPNRRARRRNRAPGRVRVRAVAQAASVMAARRCRLPSRAPGTRGSSAGISLQAGVDSVSDLPLQRPHGLFRGLALSQFLVVIGAALAVAVADLGDRGHVDGVVQAPVPAPGQPVDLAAAG